MNHHLRINELKNFFPLASPSDWRLLNAGQRVQIIKNCPFEGSKLEFGTEVIYTKNKKLEKPSTIITKKEIDNIIHEEKYEKENNY